MAIIETHQLIEALTFDDVLLRPGHSEVMPSMGDLRSRLTNAITPNLPNISRAIDTDTEARPAIPRTSTGRSGRD